MAIQRRRPLVNSQDGTQFDDGYQPGAVQPAPAPAAPGAFHPPEARSGPQVRTQPFTPPVTPPPPRQNSFGNAANLDRDFLATEIRKAFSSSGRPMSEDDLSYWLQKVSTPDIYSDEQVRVGWNPYWADRIRTGSDSSDPRLAGSEGLISNPGQYGLQTHRRANGNVYFDNEPYNHGKGPAGTMVGTDPGRDAILEQLDSRGPTRARRFLDGMER